MRGSFNIGLIEILSYVLPGAIVVATVLYRYFDSAFEGHLEGVWFPLAVLTCSYIVGHVLTLVSVVLVKFREYLKRTSKIGTKRQKLDFYPLLKSELNHVVGFEPSNEEMYLLCLRLVAENQPQSNLTIDRLYAMTLFTRNLVVSFLIVAIIFVANSILIAVLSLGLSLVFALRHMQLMEATSNTVLRSAFMYLRARNGGADAARPNTR